ncbi:DUF2993 domain-containing protein [Streptomyces sp. XM83C]|jgi:hypothetical protein|uniref:DUF2993 domain-containing protein n=1 Tax=Streptomyces thermocoprophilus TaxID=78356 RepID=A0ABV5VJV6_9ACTN|nr:DUF2993 domain-containing protein [Streptomyces sp. XM83C]MCK1823064.1 DUF2993 domain-containing protein [Streptomyces sp. XM83C]
MRALRILLVVVAILGVLFVIADRLAVNFAENEAADKVRSSEGLADTPDVSIHGFPFLTQVMGGELDDVEIGIKDYLAPTGDGARTIRIDDIEAHMKGVEFSGDYSSATAKTATGTATIGYDELLKAAKNEPTRVMPGVTAKVVGLSDGGNGKVRMKVDVTVRGTSLSRTVSVLSSVTVQGDTVRVHADSLPDVGIQIAEDAARSVTDFEQKIEQLPGGVKLESVRAAKDGVEISVRGSNVRLAG